MERRKDGFLILLILFTGMTVLLAGVQADAAAQKEAPGVTGTYSVVYKRGAGCTLKVLQLPSSKIEFALDCNRGAPSYNSGAASGVIEIKQGVAVYGTSEFGGKCEIKFEFKGTKVVVSQTGSDFDCGFGHGVTCDGAYLLKNRRPPKFEPEG
jgi:hypothetical protein